MQFWVLTGSKFRGGAVAADGASRLGVVSALRGVDQCVEFSAQECAVAEVQFSETPEFSHAFDGDMHALESDLTGGLVCGPNAHCDWVFGTGQHDRNIHFIAWVDGNR